MASEVIRSFLVALGFKTDEEGLKKFELGINKATKSVFALAAAIEATAVGVAAGVARFASNLEALYFASQRTGSAAVQLKALDLAARSLGANAGDAIAGVEGLASALRTNPGNVGLLQGLLAKLGLTIQYNADGSINAADALLKLSQVFKSMPFFQAAQFSEQLGISKDLLFQLTSGDLVGKYQKSLQLLSQTGWQDAVNKAHDFMNELRDLGAQVEVFGVQVYEAFSKKFHFSLTSIKDWLSKNGPWLADRIADVAVNVIKAAEAIASIIVKVIDKFKEWDSATGGLSTKLLALGFLLKVTGAGSIITGLIAMAGALGGIGLAGVAAAAAITSVVTAALSLKNAMQGKDASNWLSNLIDKGFGKTGSLGGWLYEATHQGEYIYERLRNGGLTRNAALGMMANFQAESGLHSTAANGDVAYGLGQWEAPRQLDFKKLFGHDIRESNTDEQVDFALWELRNKPYLGGAALSTAGSPQDAARIASLQDFRPAAGFAEADRRAAIAGNFAQNTTIHVDGSGTPDAVADRVAARQKQVNQDLARNLAIILVQ